MSKKKMTRRDRRQTRRAKKERAEAGLHRPTYESDNTTYKVSISSDIKPIKLGAAKGRDIPLPPSK